MFCVFGSVLSKPACLYQKYLVEFVLMHTLSLFGHDKKEGFPVSVANWLATTEAKISFKVRAAGLQLEDNCADQKRQIKEVLGFFLNLQTMVLLLVVCFFFFLFHLIFIFIFLILFISQSLESCHKTALQAIFLTYLLASLCSLPSKGTRISKQS